MYCPKCGNQVDLFADKCLRCGMNFKSYSISQRKKLFNQPKTTKKRNKTIDSSNVNGYQVEEGRSIHGGRLKKGSATSRDGSRFAGYDSNNAVRKAWYNAGKISNDDDNPIKLTYERKKKLEKDILGYDEEDEI